MCTYVLHSTQTQLSTNTPDKAATLNLQLLSFQTVIYQHVNTAKLRNVTGRQDTAIQYAQASPSLYRLQFVLIWFCSMVNFAMILVIIMFFQLINLQNLQHRQGNLLSDVR